MGDRILKISVVMPAYNAENYIAEAIESILNQTYTDFEFLIINDGSTDRTEEIILSYKDERIVYLKNEKNSGIVYTLNRGLKSAKGQYIARMDADDISMPERFEKQIEFMERHKDIGALGTSIVIFGEGINERRFDFEVDNNSLKSNLFFNSCFAHPSVMIRREIITKYNILYEEEYQGREDFVMWWRIAAVSKLASLQVPLLYYRQHNNQITKNLSQDHKKQSGKFLSERLKIFTCDFDEKEKSLILNYCLGKNSDYSYNDILNYIDTMKKVLDVNKVNKYYCQKNLNKVLEASVLNVIKHSLKDKSQKRELYIMGRKKKVLTKNFAFKQFVREIIGK